jgi:hypothetical protein
LPTSVSVPVMKRPGMGMGRSIANQIRPRRHEDTKKKNRG